MSKPRASGVFDFLTQALRAVGARRKGRGLPSPAGAAFRACRSTSQPRSLPMKSRARPSPPVLDTHTAALHGLGLPAAPRRRRARASCGTAAIRPAWSVVLGDEQFIFDAGSGIRELGFEVLKFTRRAQTALFCYAHPLGSHPGLPVFCPGLCPRIRDSSTLRRGGLWEGPLNPSSAGQLDREYFPVQMEDMLSDLRFRHLAENPMPVGSGLISVNWPSIPAPRSVTRSRSRTGKIAWVPDNEFSSGLHGAARKS